MMKIKKESQLLNDLSSVIHLAQDEEILIMSGKEEPVVVMSLNQYNELKKNEYLVKDKESE